MCRFIETIRIEAGRALHLHYHNLRMNQTRLAHRPDAPLLDLGDYLFPPASSEVMKCRVVYADAIEEVTYMPYLQLPVQTLSLVFSDSVEYAFKRLDRAELQQLYQQRGDKDDVLIVRNGLITDTSIANVALFDGQSWFTPKHPLLKGTRRAQLLHQGVIREREITLEELYNYSQITLFNALIPFRSLTLDVAFSTIS